MFRQDELNEISDEQARFGRFNFYHDLHRNYNIH